MKMRFLALILLSLMSTQDASSSWGLPSWFRGRRASAGAVRSVSPKASPVDYSGYDILDSYGDVVLLGQGNVRFKPLRQSVPLRVESNYRPLPEPFTLPEGYSPRGRRHSLGARGDGSSFAQIFNRQLPQYLPLPESPPVSPRSRSRSPGYSTFPVTQKQFDALLQKFMDKLPDSPRSSFSF